MREISRVSPNPARQSSGFGLWLAAAAPIAALILVPGPNFVLAGASIIVLCLGYLLLHRPGESPVLFFIFTYQWLQVSILAFYGNFLGQPLTEMTNYNSNIEDAASLSLCGLIALAIGARFATGPVRRKVSRRLLERAIQQSQKQWLRWYVAAFVSTLALGYLVTLLPTLRQPILALVLLKWAVFLIFTVVSFLRADASRLLWLAVFLVELGLSLGGYFSAFREVLFFAFIGIMISGARLSVRQIVYAGLAGLLALILAVGWTAVKSEYRDYVNGGRAAQIITVGYGERMSKLYALSAALDGEDMSEGLDRLIRRISYIEFFGASLVHVPAHLVHTDGAIWGDAVVRALIPRALNPDKPIVDDSVHTRRYTGLAVSGMERGASISLGYFGDSYVDFGRYGMMAILLLYGAVLGLIYRYFVYGRRTEGLVGAVLATTTIMTNSDFGNGITKLVPSLLLAFLGAIVFSILIAPKLFARSNRSRMRPAVAGTVR